MTTEEILLGRQTNSVMSTTLVNAAQVQILAADTTRTWAYFQITDPAIGAGNGVQLLNAGNIVFAYLSDRKDWAIFRCDESGGDLRGIIKGTKVGAVNLNVTVIFGSTKVN